MFNQMQPTTTDSGASNASDFQPMTGNPQTTQTQLFPQASSVQQPEIVKVLQNSNARISVPVNPAPAPAAVSSGKSYSGFVLLLLILGAIIILSTVYLLRRRRAETNS